MTSAEMIKLLESLGWKVDRQKGSHVQLKEGLSKCQFL